MDYWAGGYCGGIPTTSNVAQVINVPGGSTLAFWYLAYRPDLDDPAAPDHAFVSVDGTEVWTLDLIQANDTYPNWVQATVDLTAYSGDVTLSFGAVSAGSQTGNVRFDFIELLAPVACESPADVPWLSEVPDSGVTPGGETSTSEIFFDSTGLSGTYSANLCVHSDDPDRPLVTVPVSFVVGAPPEISVTPAELTQTLYPDQLATQDLNICNNGGIPLDWTLAEVPGMDWLSETPESGRVFGGECMVVTAAFDSTGLTPDSYTGALEISSNDPLVPVVTVPVTLDVLAAPDIEVTPAELAATQFADEVTTQDLNIANVGGTDLTWSIFEDNGPGYAMVPNGQAAIGAPSSNSLSQSKGFTATPPAMVMKNTDSSVLALINDGSFEQGPPPYSAWTETSDQPCEWIGDWLGAWGVGAFDGTMDYWAGGYCGGIPTSSNVAQTISVPGGSSLSFWYLAYRPDPDDPAAPDHAFLSANGTDVWTLDLVQANDTYPNWVQATVDLTGFSGDVTLSFGAVSAGSQTGNVRFDFIELLPPTTCVNPSDIPWLSEAPLEGTTIPGGSDPVVVTFDSTGQLPGDYAANLCVESNDPDTPLVVVPVAMTVLETPEANLGIMKSAMPDIIKVGDTFTYTLVITNSGPGAGVGVVVTDTLPIDFVDFVAASTGCTEITGAVTCDVGTVDLGETITLTIQVVATNDGIATNVAHVFGVGVDPDPTNNFATLDTEIQPAIVKLFLPIIQRHP